MIKTIIKFTIVCLIIAWIYGMFADYSDVKVEPVQDNCTMNSQVNNCIVLSTIK